MGKETKKSGLAPAAFASEKQLMPNRPTNDVEADPLISGAQSVAQSKDKNVPTVQSSMNMGSKATLKRESLRKSG